MYEILIHTINYMVKYMQIVHTVLRGEIELLIYYLLKKQKQNLNTLFIKKQEENKLHIQSKNQNNEIKKHQRNTKD